MFLTTLKQEWSVVARVEIRTHGAFLNFEHYGQLSKESWFSYQVNKNWKHKALSACL